MLQTLGRMFGKCSIIPGGLIILASTVDILSSKEVEKVEEEMDFLSRKVIVHFSFVMGAGMSMFMVMARLSEMVRSRPDGW